MESNDIIEDPNENSNIIGLYVGECEASDIIESRKRKAPDDVLDDRKRKPFNNEDNSSNAGEGLHLDTLSDTGNLYLEALTEGENLHLEASSEGENLHLEASNDGGNLQLEAWSEGGNLQLEASSEGENVQLEPSSETENLHLELSSKTENLHFEASSEGENVQLEPSSEPENVQIEASCEGENLHFEASNEGENLHLETSSEVENVQLEPSSKTENLKIEASCEGENLHFEASNEGENLQLEASSEAENVQLEPSSEPENLQIEASCEGENLHFEASNEGENLHLETSSEVENVQLEPSSKTENLKIASCEGENLHFEASNEGESLHLETSSEGENMQLEPSSETENLQIEASCEGENLHFEASNEGESLQLAVSSEAENLHLEASSEGERQPYPVETVTSQWWSYGAMMMCGFIWPRNSVDTAGDEISRGLKPVGIQLTSVSSGESCKFLVDAKLRSSDVIWEVIPFERKRESGRLQLFERSSFAKKGRYVDLFLDSTTLHAENSNGLSSFTAHAVVYDRNEGSTGSHELTVKITRTTYREAIIEWTCDVPEVDRWLIIIRNEGRTPRLSTEQVKDSEWMILLTPSDDKSMNRIDQSLVSLEYEAGHKYTVAVFGLCEEKTFDEIRRYMIVANSTTSFRAEHTKEDLENLLVKARGIREHTRTSFRSHYDLWFAPASYPSNDHMRCQWLYRDKPKEYFTELEMQHDNIMTVYDKDANGDPASVIHGQLKGLFFSANVHLKTGNPMNPIFGGVRVKIPALKMLSEDWKIYFADLYCLDKIHLVTLVLAEPDSEADKFCAKKLILLSRTDRNNNPFLFVSDGTVRVSSRITVEVFYTKNIDLKLLENEYNGNREEFDWWINKRHGGKWKKKYCYTCNLYTSPLPDAFAV